MTKETKLPSTDMVAGVKKEIITQLKEIQKTHSIASLVDMDQMEKSFMIAEGIGQMTNVFKENTEVCRLLTYLQGKKLGFRTDKEYPIEKVVECAVEALIRGLQLTGNQFNIIAENLYIPKEGFDYLLESLAGFVDFFIEWGDYETDKGVGKVKYKATWKYKDKEDEMVGVVPVRINSGMIVDAIYGKAERKVMAKVYKKITKSAAFFEERDLSEINTTSVSSSTPSKLTSEDGKISTPKKPEMPGDFDTFKGGS